MAKNNRVAEIGTATIAAALCSNLDIRVGDKLRDLDLSEVGMGDRGAVALSQLFREINSLEWVSLCDNDIGSRGAAAIAAALATQFAGAGIVTLELSGNDIGSEGAIS